MGANARAWFLLWQDFSTVPMEKPKSESMVSMPILDAEHTECKVEVLTTQSHIQLRGVMTLIK